MHPDPICVRRMHTTPLMTRAQGKRPTPLGNSPCTNDSFSVEPSTSLLEPICSFLTRIPRTNVMDYANPASPMYTATNGHLLVSDDHLMCSLFANTVINALPCPPRYLYRIFFSIPNLYSRPCVHCSYSLVFVQSGDSFSKFSRPPEHKQVICLRAPKG